MGKLKEFLLLILSAITLTALSGLAVLKVEHNAFIYTSFLWLLALGIFIRLSKRERSRLVAIYSGSFFMAFFLGELYFLSFHGQELGKSELEKELIYGEGHVSREIIGFAPSKNSQWREKLTHEGEVIFDVVQTIDSTGFRHTPQIDNSEKGPVLFLGCSFTFGSGLNDNETLPYYFQAASNEQFKAINMAYESYGAHQALAILQAGLEENMLNGQKPKAAFFGAITDHVFRVAGEFSKTFGPKFSLNDKGEIVNDGIVSFEFAQSEARLEYFLRKSHVLRNTLLGRRKVKEYQVQLLATMIEQSSKEFEQRYNAPLYCLLWNELASEEGLYEKLLVMLKAKGVKVIEVKDILPRYEEQKEKYFIPYDSHPTAEANALIGRYLEAFISNLDQRDGQE